jgi:hypothetical protein
MVIERQHQKQQNQITGKFDRVAISAAFATRNNTPVINERHVIDRRRKRTSQCDISFSTGPVKEDYWNFYLCEKTSFFHLPVVLRPCIIERPPYCGRSNQFIFQTSLTNDIRLLFTCVCARHNTSPPCFNNSCFEIECVCIIFDAKQYFRCCATNKSHFDEFHVARLCGQMQRSDLKCLLAFVVQMSIVILQTGL